MNPVGVVPLTTLVPVTGVPAGYASTSATAAIGVLPSAQNAVVAARAGVVAAARPVAVNAAGEKLSKQTLARAVEDARPQQVLADALDFLGQAPPDGLVDASLDALWAWARAHWSMDRVPRQRLVPAPRYG